jgi:hypothetical protein
MPGLPGLAPPPLPGQGAPPGVRRTAASAGPLRRWGRKGVFKYGPVATGPYILATVPYNAIVPYS